MKGKKRWILPVLISLLLLAAGCGVWLWNGTNRDLPLNVKITYLNEYPAERVVASKSLLLALSEEELFTYFDTAVFRGTVTEISNVEIDFNGAREYRALVKILVENVYRGKCTAGDTVTVMAPCPIGTNTWVEDTDVISNLRVGMCGIFMPIIYDEESVWSQNEASIRLQEICAYGFADGMRYAFLETGPDGAVTFARDSYESISNAKNLAEVEAYVITMIEQTTNK